MDERNSIGVIALAAALLMTVTVARAFDDTKYPDLKGQWRAIGGPMRFDGSKPWGPGQEAPLTAEYQAIFEANLADQAAGGQGYDRDFVCQSPGMPRITNAYGEMEIVITPDTIHVLIQHIHDNRRIFTDGRDWPADVEPTFGGYSIGTWIDTEGNGNYDLLEVETRGFKGPRAYDTSGIPLHKDNQTIVKERIYLDKANPDLLHDDMTVIDNALTRPWTVAKKYRRDNTEHPVWPEDICPEGNGLVFIGTDMYFQSGEGFLMPAKKGQEPPDLRYFNQPKK